MKLGGVVGNETQKQSWFNDISIGIEYFQSARGQML